MRRLFTAGLLGLSGAVALGSQAHATPPQTTARASVIADLLLSALVEANDVPGMGASVWQNGQTVWIGSAGLADRETGRAVDADTVFRLASVSKLLAVTAAAKLSEDGRLDLDAPVRSIAPWLPDRWPEMTARQLASHTSGMPHYNDADDGVGFQQYGPLREIVPLFQDRDLLTPPGTAYEYSSWAYVLLAAEIEAVTGMAYLDYLAAEITPGLTIQADTIEPGIAHIAAPYAFEKDGTIVRAEPWNLSFNRAGAGMAATPVDLAVWGGRVIEGQVVSPATLARILEPTTFNNGEVVRDGNYTVGFGWRTYQDADGRLAAHHNGATVGARSALMIYPEQKVSVSVLSNASTTSAIDVTAQMLAAPFLADREQGPAAPCPVEATAYEGLYKDKTVQGTARFAIESDMCVGELSIAPGHAFGDWVNGFPQGDVETLKIIGVDADNGLRRAALVTPLGLYDLRIQGDGQYQVSLGGNPNVTLTIALR
jgi:CubicO group peptidase (beta-lactamase class C family)